MTAPVATRRRPERGRTGAAGAPAPPAPQAARWRLSAAWALRTGASAGFVAADMAALWAAEHVAAPVWVDWTLYAFPVIAVAVFCPSARRRWWRIPAVVAVVAVASPAWTVIVAFGAETWLVGRSWDEGHRLPFRADSPTASDIHPFNATNKPRRPR